MVVLKNENMEVHIGLPIENYQLGRFDWTGKIEKVTYRDTWISGFERNDLKNSHLHGRGFYNEFGIDTALGFEDAEIGGWFHKIGIGALRKDRPHYVFSDEFEIKPAEFITNSGEHSVSLECISSLINGYAYKLNKDIQLLDDGFIIKYNLLNTGEKPISTNEYNHNFLAFENNLSNRNGVIKFPFEIMPELFHETVNPEGKVTLGKDAIIFSPPINDPFFFSNLSGGHCVKAEWELLNLNSNIAIKEIGDFETSNINLWGWKEVVSPELFFHIHLDARQSISWSRTYSSRDIR